MHECYCCISGLVELEKVDRAEKVMPDDYSTGNDVTEPFLKYARPLIGGPLPKYVQLERHPVPKLLNRI
jgi:hypothetical protein